MTRREYNAERLLEGEQIDKDRHAALVAADAIEDETERDMAVAAAHAAHGAAKEAWWNKHGRAPT